MRSFAVIKSAYDAFDCSVNRQTITMQSTIRPQLFQKLVRSTVRRKKRSLTQQNNKQRSFLPGCQHNTRVSAVDATAFTTVNTLVSLTRLLYSAERFPRFTLHYCYSALFSGIV